MVGTALSGELSSAHQLNLSSETDGQIPSVSKEVTRAISSWMETYLGSNQSLGKT
jgi:hypothetical protein